MGEVITFTDNFDAGPPGVTTDTIFTGARVPAFNLWDGAFPYAGWSPGAAAVHPVALSPRLSERWTVLSWSITVQGLIVPRQAPSYGRLGALYGGLVLGSQNTRQSVTLQLEDYGLPWVNPYRPPGDTTMIAKLWDGQTDAPWPVIQSSDTPPIVPISTSFSLPVPLALQSGRQFSIGLWLSPSLIVNTNLGVFGASYSVTFQDDTDYRGA